MDWMFLGLETARLVEYSLAPPSAQPLGVEGRPAVALGIDPYYQERSLDQKAVALKRAWVAVLEYPQRLEVEDGLGWPFQEHLVGGTPGHFAVFSLSRP